MKKTLILLVIACLGLGSGVYVAHQSQSYNLTQLFVKNTKTLTPTSWTVTHPSWSGKFTKTAENRVKLDMNGDMATIISDKEGLLTVKWDKWGTETFSCDSKNSCTLKK